MTIKESALYGVASALLTFMLISSWLGYQQAGYVAEFNPVAKGIFEWLYYLTGSLTLSVLVFVPLTIIGIFFAAILVDRDLKKSGYLKSKQVVFSALIFLLIPNALYNARILKMDLRLLTVICLLAAGVYLLSQCLFWKRDKNRSS